MLKTIDLIKEIGQDYAEMLKQVNIPDFYKCIAQYSGIEIGQIKDEVIIKYLTKWAKNKKYIFDVFDNQLKVDMPIEYNDEDRNYGEKLKEIGKKFPAYYDWLLSMRYYRKNIMTKDPLDWRMIETIEYLFPDYKFNGEAITHFFKNKLSAPDELVTEIGRLYENLMIKANFTLSIDPVDIMLSSENPYNWQSCYRLETPNESSHADGCLAGVLDCATIVTYIWKEEGKFTLYHKYDFKNIRFKMMRMTIAVNSEFNAIHFNSIYPGRDNLSEGFHKLLREKVETYFANKINKPNLWKKNDLSEYTIMSVRRHFEYGYNEYDSSYVYLLKEEEHYEPFFIYNEEIPCPCGCGCAYTGSDVCEDEYEYDGWGHTNERWSLYEDNQIYCSILDEYEDCDEDCRNCRVWNEHNAECELTGERCDNDDVGPYEFEEEGKADFDDSNVLTCCAELCHNCPHYQEHHPDQGIAAQE